MNITSKPLWNFILIPRVRSLLLRDNWMALAFCLCLVSCSEEIYLIDTGQEYEETKSLRSTKSIVPITVCTDAYIIVGGGSLGNNYQKVYQSTTCRTCMIDVNDLEEDEYIAGVFPQYGTATNKGSGGGNGSSQSFYVGDHWQFVFPTINKLYGYGSTLNIYQKGLLEGAMTKFKEQPIPFSDLYDWLVKNNIKIKFNIDSSIQALAQYSVTDDGCCISFQNESSINCYSLSEELVHAVQHQRFYKSEMTKEYKDYEFEAKVFRDIAYNISYYYDDIIPPEGFTPNTAASADGRLEFEDKYDKWIEHLAEKGCCSGSSSNEYCDLCKIWQGAPGTYKGITPRLIETYFRKPRPRANPKD